MFQRLLPLVIVSFGCALPWFQPLVGSARLPVTTECAPAVTPLSTSSLTRNLCADDILTTSCDPGKETECRCNESNGNCKKHDHSEDIGNQLVGNMYEVYVDYDVCVCTYRCVLYNPSWPGCVDDGDCVKDDTTDPVDCPWLQEQYLWGGSLCVQP